METRRHTVPAAEEILGEKIDCLDHGHVALVEYLGGDETIERAARLSYGKAGPRDEKARRNLLRYLMRNRHTSPFEQVVLTFDCKMPIFVARQWVRHRTARLNEMSGRYSELPEEFYVPDQANVLAQSASNKQGREGLPLAYAGRFVETCRTNAKAEFEDYKGFINEGVAKELARINLPLSTYTQWVWQIDLHNLFHFLGLRLDTHAQYEIRVFAEALARCAKAVAPIAYEAFEDYRLNAVTLSAAEAATVKSIIADSRHGEGALDYACSDMMGMGCSEREIEGFKKAFNIQ